MSATTRAYSLLAGATATGNPVSVTGGRYIWAIQAGTWNGATATLQVLGPDGSTYQTVATATADTNVNVLIGEGASMKVAISVATPTNVNSTLRGV